MNISSPTENFRKLQAAQKSPDANYTDNELENGTNPSKSGAGPLRKAGSGPGRKPKACLECKKLKMKCEIFPGDRKCRHCLRRKVDCIIKRTFMAQLHSDDPKDDRPFDFDGKIDAMREEIKQMKQSLDAVLGKAGGLSHVQNTSHASPNIPSSKVGSRSPEEKQASSTPVKQSPSRLTSTRKRGDQDTNTRLEMAREDSPNPVSEDDQQYGPETLEEPMGSLYQVTRLKNIRNNQANNVLPHSAEQDTLDDFISRGVISEEQAEGLYKIFQKTLNHYLWVGIEEIHSSWTSVRRSSELLAATILTVTALHLPDSADTFDACYNEFLSLVSSSMFSRYHSVDDVRGLCISAFWLSEHSWKLTGHAIRIATELGIHQSFILALEGDKSHFLKARLWYMLYVCDRHFSIAYGRPPTVIESTQIRQFELFRASPFSSVLDTRILSQVSLMQILTQVYERFSERPLPSIHQVRTAGYGGNYTTALRKENYEGCSDTRSSAVSLSESDFDTLRRFNVEVDHWRMRWYERQPPSPFIGQFTNKGVILYSYFAKLQINALSIRGVSINSNKMSTERKEFANMAISAASSILTLVQEEGDLRRALVGTPLYVHTMIAFASVFLMKVATKWDRIMGLNIEYANVSHLLEKMVTVLKEAVTSDRHMLKHIGQGLEKMLMRMWTTRKQEAERQVVNANAGYGSGTEPVSYGWQFLSTGQVGEEAQSKVLEAAEPGLAETQVLNQSWDPNAFSQQESTETELGGGLFGDDLTGMNEAFMYQAFGTGSAGDVYNMLSSQFLY
ncbi:C6 transcription factor [Colletotrichum truncatum]|uniref:C6 transcription factor n=1 Tax=Colletotrichum truncatum TaxID=5467 RepID=A0ACC3Z8U9_COLTU|nr:C6 transcription factor [Colletotrichum truncatum]KAF6780803.1 C6 transcription factor [Colletotrichum truncatum]